MARTPPQTAAAPPPRRRAPRLSASAGRSRSLGSPACGRSATPMPRAAARNGRPRSAGRGARRGPAQRQPPTGCARDRRTRLHGRRLRSESSSRATMILPDGGTLRLDENSALALPEPPSGLGSLIELLRGIIHVISRDPRSLSFKTPTRTPASKAPSSTFASTSNERLTEIVVLEGEVVVTTPTGELNVASDHVAIAKDGEAPTALPYRQPIERMRWASHYPPLIDRPLPGARPRADRRRSRRTRTFLRSEPRRAWRRRGSKPPKPTSRPRCASPRGNATALSLSALLALARADRDSRTRASRRGPRRRAESVVARLALSHVEQSATAWRPPSARCAKRSRSSPTTPSSSTRLAEIALARGDARTAIATLRAHGRWPRRKAPRSSCSASPTSVRSIRPPPRTLRGSRRARARRTDAAARLGADLIHGNDLVEGRRQLELAVALDPANPLTRSYMAKVYDAENRGDLTASQLELAKSSTPFDPTPWLYSALHNLRANRPVEALRNLRCGAARTATARSSARGSARRGPRHAQRRARPRAHRARLRPARAARRVARDRRRPDEFRGPSAARRWLRDRAAARDRARQRAARLAAAAAGQRHARQATARATEPVLRATRGPEPHVIRRVRLRRDRERPQAPRVRVGGGNGIARRRRHVGRPARPRGVQRGSLSLRDRRLPRQQRLRAGIANAFVQFQPNYDTNLQAELRSSRTEHGDLALSSIALLLAR